MASGGLLHDSLTDFNNIVNCNVVMECGPRHITLLGLILKPTATALLTIGGVSIVSVVIFSLTAGLESLRVGPRTPL
jgi:hypothetical protein